MEEQSGYIPGACNIGKEEVRRRRNGAIFSGILSVLLIAILLLTHADKLWRLLIFIPVTSFATGIQQWYYRFCLGFGMKGVFNFKEPGQTTTVEGDEMRKADKRKAIKMIVTAILFGIAATIIFYIAP
ncbi:MAG: hypothetical protein ACLQQ4_15640 [Bacteroidia bacterium]